jgi:phosphodiesterase/alkaline phosphatase D-like protein/Leucine-rich repeat (LRR) protein
VDLSLSGNGLNGPIPPALGNLAQLLALDLSSNLLTGSIPEELGNLSNINMMSLEGNQYLTGAFPISFTLAKLPYLFFLGFDCWITAPNQDVIDLLDTVSPGWQDLTCAPYTSCAAIQQIPATECDALVSLYNGTAGAGWQTKDNWLEVDTPCAWAGVTCNVDNTHVSGLGMAFNQLTGSIPSTLGSLTQLTNLDLSYNNLSGSIPPALGSLTQLTNLDLSGNSLSGSIPPALGSLTQLTSLNLYGNSLSGSIPVELGTLVNLTTLNLDYNSLSGSLPTQIGNLTQLTDLYLNNNFLSGDIPTTIKNLTQLINLQLSCGLNSSDSTVMAFLDSKAPGWKTALCVTTITGDTPDPSTPGQSVNVTVTVGGGTTIPTGYVDITGADANCIISLASGAGNCNVTFNTSGAKTLTAAYNGTGLFSASGSSASAPHAVNSAAPIATTNAASDIATTGATLNGTVNANGSNTTVTFEYGLTTGYGTTVTAAQSPVTGATATAVSAAITGLTPNMLYHFRVIASSAGGTTNGSDQTFTTLMQPPTAITDIATGVSVSGATMNGTVNANDGSTTVTFEYGPTTSYGTSVTATPSPVTGSTDTAVSAILTGLTSDTTYHFRVKAVSAGGTSYGDNLTFYTNPQPPTAATNAATVITATGATLNGAVNANNNSTNVTFEYGLDTSYGTTVTATESPVSGATSVPVSAAITGLLPNTMYHYRVQAVNTAGAINGSDQTFTTLPLPTATTDAATLITTTGATLNGTVNAQGGNVAVTFEYGTTAAYGLTVTASPSPVNGSTDVTVSAALTGLLPNTLYHFRVIAGAINGSDQTFTTLPLPTATTNAATLITTTGATLNGMVNANGGSATVSFEYGMTESYGTTVTASPSSVNGSTDVAVSAALTGLLPSTIYHFRVIAGASNGSDLTFTTATPNSAPTNILLSAMAVAENKPIATLVGNLTTTDPNPNSTFTYALVTGAPGCATTNNNASFQIVNAALKTKVKFNFEAKNSYVICIRVTDNGGLTFSKSFTIKVTNVLDEVAKNGGFETYTGLAKIPTYWLKNTNFGALDGKSNLFKTGKWAVKIANTTSKVKTLTQSLPIATGAKNQKFVFSYWVKGTTVPTSTALCQGQVLLYNSLNKLVKTYTLPCGKIGTFGYSFRTLTFTTPVAYNKAVIKFTYSKANSAIWFDAVSLKK